MTHGDFDVNLPPKGGSLLTRMNIDRIRDIQKKLNLGATGIYPQGKPFNPSDEGELKSTIVKDENGIFIILGKPVEWLALTKDGARDLGTRLINMANDE